MFSFLLRSVGRRDLSAGPEPKKNTTQGVFFCSGPGERQGKEKPRWAPARGQSKKKNTLGGVFSFCCGPARTLTHSLRAWVAMPRPGGATAKKTTPRVVFFLLRPRADAHSLTVGLGGNASARRGHSKKKNTPGGVFSFCCGPARTLTHSLRAWVAMPQQKKHPGWCCFCCGPARTLTHSLRACVAMPRPGGAAAAPPGLLR